jgi:ATP-binding cassette, subfamily B (MDR/TAP), member 1
MNLDDIREDNIWYMIIGLHVAATALIYSFCFSMIGSKIINELKWRYLKSILCQDTEWFDQRNVEELPTEVHANMKEAQGATGRTIAFIFHAAGLALCSLCIWFVTGAVLACCFIGIFPYLFGIGGFQDEYLQRGEEENEVAFRQSGAQAEQALNAVKVVKAFGQEQYECEKFDKKVNERTVQNKKRAIIYGLTFGLVESGFYFQPGFFMFIGGIFITSEVNNGNSGEHYDAADVVSSLALNYTVYYLGNWFLNFKTLQKGLVCAKKIIDVIERTPTIKLDDDTAEPWKKIDRDILIDKVSFTYQEKANKALDDVTLTIESGKTTAIVGPSGCGKSTLAKLLERFYDPQEGSIMVNGKNLKDINLRQYRRRIGYVGQEPCLLNETIKENLLNSNPDATDEQIIDALKKANAYKFVMKLDKNINSEVGALGGMISGGQKQRLAIARALLRNPDLLIFDEATSALDHKGELKVQDAIDEIAKATTITKVVIAHRLSTIKDADKIVVMDSGKIWEIGTHDQLIANNQGIYAELCRTQEQADALLKQIEKDHSVKNSSHSKKLLKERSIDENKQVSQSIDNNETESEDELNENGRLVKTGSSELVSQNEPKNLRERMSMTGIMIALLPYNTPTYFLYVVLLFSTLSASLMPWLSYPVYKLLLDYTGNDNHYIRHRMAIFIPIIFGLGIGALICQWITSSCLFVLTANMFASLRSSVYSKMIRQPIDFYNSKENSTGQLTATLSADMRVVNGASIHMFFLIYQGFWGLISGIVICYVFSWSVGLFATLIVPVNTIAMGLNMAIQMRSNPRTIQHENQQRLIISDSISNYMTVGSLAQEDVLIDRHFKNQRTNLREDAMESFKFSFIYWIIACSFPWYFFVIFYVIAQNVEDGKDITDLFICLFATLYATVPLTLALLNAPDYGKGREAADKVLYYNNHEKEGSLKSSICDGDRELTDEIASGTIEFHHVWFRYPSSNKDHWVLKDFSLKIEAGECVGLAGESGCGKSTVTQLLYRFYDPQKGYITIGGYHITEFTLKSLRAHFGLVQQEPLIFNCSIMENIVYGKPSATAQDIQRAAQIANCHEFIEREDFEGEEIGLELQESFQDDPRYSQLPNGYKTICGPRGGRLSGGQKQRVAIARAVVRQPNVLVLDEATSALDENSQKVVQGALDKVMKKCTSIVIAHRLSTLSKCDRVVRIAEGVIISNH